MEDSNWQRIKNYNDLDEDHPTSDSNKNNYITTTVIKLVKGKLQLNLGSRQRRAVLQATRVLHGAGGRADTSMLHARNILHLVYVSRSVL